MYWITVIGGGTGLSTVLSGVKRQRLWSDISAIVAVSDDGGGNGRHRDEFGVLPVSDFRKAIVALADDTESAVLRELFMYRFRKGEGLSGNTFGNLLLIALTDILGSEDLAIEHASRILRANGRVLPVAHEQITLAARYEDGSVVRSEDLIDEPRHDGTLRIEELWIEPDVQVSGRARRAVEKADVIVVGPGDLYTSSLANVVVPGMADALAEAPGKIVFLANLMTKFGQTHGFRLSDYVSEYERYLGRPLDHILVNTTPLPPEILTRYEAERDYPVVDDLSPDASHVTRCDLLAEEEVEAQAGDTLKRSLIRHDPDKIADALAEYATAHL
ncbi:uridine diphosphate-N-acetylglucosamine-binding protein YvcK [Patescibacteria group bacterium]|jgi:uncharacterized cofD-like protein|nr:uridine diphosphate-N-acetylglucosamine-binding protein YvcK [Patescibacteria group bacterium]